MGDDLDQFLIVLGTSLSEVDTALRQSDADNILDPAERQRLIGRWLELLDAISQAQAHASTGRRIKAGAIMLCASSRDRAGSPDATLKIAVSLAADVLLEDEQ